VNTESNKNLISDDKISRRNILQAGSLGALGVTLPNVLQAESQRPSKMIDDEQSLILIHNTGGPSQLDTWDPKPHSPSEVRGPFQPISTVSSEIQISELFPNMARHADKFSLIRSCYHTSAADHDTGQQLMQTGRVPKADCSHPHIGSVLSHLKGSRQDLSLHMQIDGLTQRDLFELSKEPEKVRERYGENRLGRSFLRARKLVESGVRFVSVNSFGSVFNEITWDIHGREPYSTVQQMKDIVAPMYDQAYSALLEDLFDRGMLEKTMVCNLAEFGRTPRINQAGGRDHWPECWTVHLAGGSIQGGRVIGRSDQYASEPVDRPVTPAEIVATIYKNFNLELAQALPRLDPPAIPLVDPGVKEIHELF
jgi:hypothetical protein